MAFYCQLLLLWRPATPMLPLSTLSALRGRGRSCPFNLSFILGGAKKPFQNLTGVTIRVILKRQFAAFDSLVVNVFFRQTETP